MDRTGGGVSGTRRDGKSLALDKPQKELIEFLGGGVCKTELREGQSQTITRLAKAADRHAERATVYYTYRVILNEHDF